MKNKYAFWDLLKNIFNFINLFTFKIKVKWSLNDEKSNLNV